MRQFQNNKLLLRILSVFILFSFLSNAIFPSFVHASDLALPNPTQLVSLSDSYSFPMLKGMKFDPSNPLNMEFIIDTADKRKVSQDEASVLIKYFLAGLTIPEEELWVNMSPYEADKMITPALSQTDLGKDLLSQDYILKQLSSSLTYPETEIGKDFWLKTYQEVLKVAKTTNIPVNTFNKLWIVPDKALVEENGNFAFIKSANLKAMLEEDYLALKNNIGDIQKQKKGLKEELIQKVNEASSGVVRNTILPKINTEVNSGKNFATLRQIYYSLVLGVWFKKRFKDSIYSYYINQGNVKGIDLSDKGAKDKIYNLYVEAFKKGVYNYIKSEKDLGTGRNLKRQYFSGGFSGVNIGRVVEIGQLRRNEDGSFALDPKGTLDWLKINLKPQGIEAGVGSSGVEAANSPVAQETGKKVFFFGEEKSEGASLISDNGERKILLGGKGAGLNEMTAMGIPVPPGFTIDTTVGVYYLKNNAYPPGAKEQIYANLKRLESLLGSNFGDPNNPLLLSVRSGARKSMPGMMDTVLNLGLNDLTAEGLGKKTNNPRFAYDSYRRFIAAFAKIVLEIEDADEKFSEIFDQVKREENIELSAETDASLSYEALKNKVIPRYKALVLKETGKEFPVDPMAQLDSAIEAVFKSWNSQRAQDYREQNKIPADWGTACNVQAMVFGNTGENSGTGVYFTRDNNTGENVPFGDFLFNAQGEDVVSGDFNTLKIADLKERMPDIYAQLIKIGKTLETVDRDMNDTEFTIQEGKLYMLQKRVGKRTGLAAIKIAVDMVKEGLITKKEAVLRVEGADIAQLVHPQIDPKEKTKPIAEGRAGSRGAAWGKITFDTKGVLSFKAQGDNVILVRTTTSTSDFKGMVKSDGILTGKGGETSHAAIVCKSERKVGVFGAAKLIIDYKNKTVTIGDLVLREGDIVTLDATNKKVYLGKLPLIPGRLTEEAKELLAWDDEIRRLGVRANADTPEQAKKALEFGAKGIGLLRVEHWIQVNPELQKLFQLWILTDDPEIKQIFLNKIEPLFKKDMKEVLKTMQGYPVTVRTLDPPLHEFLPHDPEEIKELARELNRVVQQHTGSRQSRIRELYNKMLEKIDSLQEVNPMLGRRGVRLGITDPEITEMQFRAIFSAGVELVKEGIQAIPEVMIPVVAVNEEFMHQEKIGVEIKSKVMKEYGIDPKSLPQEFGVIGTMIELPAAAYAAGELAKEAEFFSFGTNDLTQTTMGLSRDDTADLTTDYEVKEIFPYNPFVTLHPAVSYGQMKTAVQRGRKTKPGLKIGICGEHGRDSRSIEIADELGLDYVSPSGDGILVARHAAAQSQIKREMAQAAKLTVPLKEAYDELVEIIAAHKQGTAISEPEFVNFKGTFSFEQDKNNPKNLLIENFLPILLREIMLEKEAPESPDAAIISITRLPNRRLQFKQITPESIFRMKESSQRLENTGAKPDTANSPLRSVEAQLAQLDKFVNANKGKGSIKGQIEDIYASVYTFFSKTATHPSFGVGLSTKGATGINEVAQTGTSAGLREPITLSPKDSYQTEELKVFNEHIKPFLLDKNVADIVKLDEELERISRSLKPSPERPDLIYAGPAITATSMALLRGLARSANVDDEIAALYLYNQLAKKHGAPELKELNIPIYMAKVNDGGMHGATFIEERLVDGELVKVKLPELPYQEFMFAPIGYTDNVVALKELRRVNEKYYQLVKEKYNALSKDIDDALARQKTSIDAILKEIEGRESEPFDVIAEANATLYNLIKKLAIEYGFGAEAAIKSKLLTSNREILGLMTRAIKESNAVGVFIVRDDAASELYNHPGKEGLYYLGADGRENFNSPDGYVTMQQKIELEKMFIRDFPRLASVEDGFSEEDPKGWKEGTRQLGDRILIVGDDRFVSAPELVERGVINEEATGLLDKLNQGGTVSRALESILLARILPVRLHNKLPWLTVSSHRSGEPAEQNMMAVLSLITDFIKTTVGSTAGGGQGREAKVNFLSMTSEKWRSRGMPLPYVGARILKNPQRGWEKIVKEYTEKAIYTKEDVEKAAASPVTHENAANSALRSGGLNTPGGIDLERITVDTTGQAASSPIGKTGTVPIFSFGGGLTFQIIKLEEIKNLNNALSEWIEPAGKKQQLAHKR